MLIIDLKKSTPQQKQLCDNNKPKHIKLNKIKVKKEGNYISH